MQTLVSQLSVVKKAHLQTLAFARPRLSRCGLTPSRFELLRAVQKAGGTCDQRELTTFLSVSGASVCRLLRVLVTLGYVEHLRDQPDGRRRTVRITADGAERAKKGSAALQGRLT